MCIKVVDNHPSTTKYVLGQYKMQEICIRAVNTCLFVFDSVLDQCKTQEIRAVDDNPSTIKYVPDRYKTQEMCDNAVDDKSDALEFVPDRYNTPEMCDKAIDDYSVALEFVPDQYKSKEMCDKIISENPFMIKHFPDKYITHKMRDEAVYDFLPTLNFIPNWFVASKMIKKLFTGFYADENILYFNEDFCSVVFNCNEMCVLNIDVNNINLDNHFDENDPDTIIHVRLLAWHIKFEKCKALKNDISKELMPVA